MAWWQNPSLRINNCSAAKKPCGNSVWAFIVALRRITLAKVFGSTCIRSHCVLLKHQGALWRWHTILCFPFFQSLLSQKSLSLMVKVSKVGFLFKIYHFYDQVKKILVFDKDHWLIIISKMFVCFATTANSSWICLLFISQNFVTKLKKNIMGIISRRYIKDIT